ncbi:hypothetical protein M408DRAFT_114122 [Serendipita vermifera MAFF 305830]|uniref:ABC1 atypical kinase-like domain-containing protein n=1 Tax=Serendipita vermifera MAFF 305830 TaxID=933852 RepID=A0A0C2WTJ3_SERVB|nr:hypothetical protein M408DRAFT_114122 [Serendipita vermifera MAFF 305830]
MAALGTGVGALFTWDYYFGARTLSRNTRTVYNGILIVLDYKLNYDTNDIDKMNGVHERSAQRLLHVCRKNGGLYVKAGQAIGIQVAILPKPYHVLAQMFDGAEPIPLDAVRNVIREELGMWPEEIFAEFDPNPIGSASIAQVHRARLHTGETVAVKVQRPDIRRHASWDLLAFRLLMQIYERVFEIPFTFASQYISDQIELETHFDHERLNTERIRNHVLNDAPKHLKGGVAYVPAVYPSLSSPRLLVMEYIDGAVKMTDVEGLENRLGLNVNEVMNSVCEVFAAQVFRWGFVNADPHPSNVLIRRHPQNPSTHQVVLIDHGLSIPLAPAFREQYLRLWQYLFANDVEGIKDICKGWGVNLGSDAMGAQMLGSAVLLQGWSGRGRRPGRHGAQGHDSSQSLAANDAESTATSKEEKKKKDLETQRAMKATVKRFLENYEMIPKELIFLGRSMRIIQANNQALGAPVDRISILAKGACDSLYDLRMHPPATLKSSPNHGSPLDKRRVSPPTSWIRRFISANVDWFKFRLAIAGMDVAFGKRGLFWGLLWLKETWQTLSGALKISTAHSIEQEEKEDPVQEQIMAMGQEFGVEIDEKLLRG